jgi:required for meiotic nuclear division protein 1
MRCSSFCTTDSYKLLAIANYFKNKGFTTRQYRKVLHIVDNLQNGDVFIFSYGCVVTWGLTRLRETWLLKEIEPFAVKLLSSIESDYFLFRHSDHTEMLSHPRFNADIILLDSDNSQLKLAISYGIAKSIQLESSETAVQKIIDKNMPFFDNVPKWGSFSQKEITKRIAEIFVARSQINLNSEYLEAPEYFWEHPNLETYYVMSEKFLDISRRVTALNQKLDVLHELFDMLMNQLQHRHSNFLEIVIILLILIEIAWSVFLYLIAR